MNYGFRVIHKAINDNEDYTTVSKFIRPKNYNPITWLIALLVCTDIYYNEDKAGGYEELNPSWVAMAIFLLISISMIILVLAGMAGDIEIPTLE